MGFPEFIIWNSSFKTVIVLQDVVFVNRIISWVDGGWIGVITIYCRENMCLNHVRVKNSWFWLCPNKLVRKLAKVDQINQIQSWTVHRGRPWCTCGTWNNEPGKACSRAAGSPAHTVQRLHQGGRHWLLLVLLRAHDQGNGWASCNSQHIACS